MQPDLERRMIAARERWIEVGGRRYKIRRPLQIELRRLFAESKEIGERLALHFVVDWEGVTEQDLLPGIGGDMPVPFDRSVYEQWIGDRLEDLRALADAIWTEYQAHQERLGAIPGK